MYERILVPTDGSAGAQRAFDQAIDLAATYGATLHGLYVIEQFYVADIYTEEVEESLKMEGEQALQRLRELAESRGIMPVTELRAGAPHRAILDYVVDNDIDLIVMGTHGRSGLDRYLLGSITERIVRLSEVPVLTVQMPSSENA